MKCDAKHGHIIYKTGFVGMVYPTCSICGHIIKDFGEKCNECGAIIDYDYAVASAEFVLGASKDEM